MTLVPVPVSRLGQIRHWLTLMGCAGDANSSRRKRRDRCGYPGPCCEVGPDLRSGVESQDLKRCLQWCGTDGGL